MTTLALIAAAFVIGFLLGDRRAVMHFNQIVTEHNTRLENIILEQAGSESDEAVISGRPTLH